MSLLKSAHFQNFGVDFINDTDLDEIKEKANIIDAFFAYAQEKQKAEASELIVDENLNEEAAKRYILTSLKRKYARPRIAVPFCNPAPQFFCKPFHSSS